MVENFLTEKNEIGSSNKRFYIFSADSEVPKVSERQGRVVHDGHIYRIL